MKVLIIFRGDYSLVDYPRMVCKNIHKHIIQPLIDENICFHTMFSTYKTDLAKLGVYESALNPIKIQFSEYVSEHGQIKNFKDALVMANDTLTPYDYILFLRFDIVYKMNIKEWNIFGKDGLILPYKENSELTFLERGFYGDCIIIFSQYAFTDAVYSLMSANFNDFFLLHNIAYLIRRRSIDIDVHTIINDYYQSNTGLLEGDKRLNPIYIQVKYEYHGTDKDKYTECLNTSCAKSLNH